MSEKKKERKLIVLTDATDTGGTEHAAGPCDYHVLVRTQKRGARQSPGHSLYWERPRGEM